ncbi:GNAT family N-acetyltransferase [Streptomyces niveus]|uniref:GNAT family N-acetyltransferase n=1 Tax=Streptomyces niveus TaxID=193462 RepID=A0ABZ1ZY37_STRNV|nr:GNAT family N-acetyltransferase [Streptomyces niveus]
MGLLVRAMTADDCDAVAAVRIGGWRWAYAGLMPQAYLDAMSVEEDAADQRARLNGTGTTDSRVVNVVAERAGTVVGWGCLGPCRDPDVPDGAGELYALYVGPGHVSTGVGRALARTLVERAAVDGFSSLVLWVLKENDRARRFYEKAGFTPDGAEEPFDVGGALVPEVRYARSLTRAG